MAELGCASHTYTITDRDGGLVSASGILVAVQYNRVLNDSSTAAVSLGVSGPDCCAEMGDIRSWRHRLNIYRGGSFVWSGFVTNVDWKTDRTNVTAVDMIGLLDRRVPHQAFVFTGTDLTEIARQLVDDGLAPDDPGHTTTVIGPAGVLGGRTYEKSVGQTADHLRDLADTGIDFTAIGANVVILPDDFCDVVGRLSDEDLPEGVTVSEDGASLATRQIVAGSQEGTAIGTAGGINPYYGLLEVYTEQTTITDQASADAAAAAKLKASLGVPVFIDTQNVTLAPTAPIGVPALVPGWCVDISTDSTCRTITQRLKITGLQVTEDGGSNETPGQEKVVLQVTATGGNLQVVGFDTATQPATTATGS